MKISIMTYVAAASLVAAFASSSTALYYWRQLGIQEVQCAESFKTARAEGEVQAYKDASDKSAGIAQLAVSDREELILRLEGIVSRAQQKVTVYRDRIRNVPAPACGPGRERVDALNEALK